MAKTIKVNGKQFTVVSARDGYVSLRGTRGADYAMVQNVHSGRWTLCGGGSWRRAKSVPVESVEGL